MAVKSGLLIHPYDKRGEIRRQEQYEIFYLPNRELSLLSAQIFQNTLKIEKLRLQKLPPVAETQLFMTNLVHELQSTNEIEGIRSTRKELQMVVQRIMEKKFRQQRFEGLVKQHLRLRTGKHFKITAVADFRIIWDKLLS